VTIQQQIVAAFESRFGGSPSLLVRAPGRVNLIGEHTDYNGGYVLPMAIERAVWIALRPRIDRQVRVASLDFGQLATFSLDDLQRGGSGWIEYLKGVSWALEADGYRLRGWEGTMAGDVPIGAGLSSSAAIEMATARAFAVVSGFAWEPLRMAQAGRRAENKWVGVSSGIMDQMASAASVAGHALFLDCRSLEYEHVPLIIGVVVIVLDTATRRGLVDSGYNERFKQCQAAARQLGVALLRDASLESLQKKAGELDEVILRRARHIVTEDQRVLEAVQAMRAGNVVRLGQLLDASHFSMRDDFEITNEALNIMVSCARKQKGCYGARMTGGGFGGCALAMVEAEQAWTFSERVVECYRKESGLEPTVYICQASQGASVMTL
jgi:galactokinase